MNRRVTMDDIARQTRLSKMTVSRVLSNKGYCSQRTRQRVLAAANRLDYQVNRLASLFSSDRAGLLGVIAPFEGLIGTYYFGQVLQGIQRVIAKAECHMVLFDSLSEQLNEGTKCANLCRQKRVDGLIVVAPHTNDRFVRTFANLKVPLVVVGSSFGEKTISFVDVDNFGGASAATEHLITLGHRKIGFVCGRNDLRDAVERERAFRSTMERHTLALTDRWILRGDYETHRAFQVARELLESNDRPTAMFAANDLMAFGVIHAARMLGLRVPEELSVVGFDDLQAAAESVPPLTTVHQPISLLGEEAAGHLMRILNDRKNGHPLQLQLDTHLIVRGSTAPPRPV